MGAGGAVCFGTMLQYFNVYGLPSLHRAAVSFQSLPILCPADPGYIRYCAILPSMGAVAGHFDCMHFINASVVTSGGEFGLIHLQAALF